MRGMIPTDEQLFRWANRFITRSGDVDLPTVRQAAKRFRCTQTDIIDCIDGAAGVPCDGEYFGYNVGVGIPGVGNAEHDNVGDYTIEAWLPRPEAI